MKIKDILKTLENSYDPEDEIVLLWWDWETVFTAVLDDGDIDRSKRKEITYLKSEELDVAWKNSVASMQDQIDESMNTTETLYELKDILAVELAEILKRKKTNEKN